MSIYSPISFEAERYGTYNTQPPRCRHCGQRAFVHEVTGRCYTMLELEAALRFMQAHQRWPDGMLWPLPEENVP